MDEQESGGEPMNSKDALRNGDYWMETFTGRKFWPNDPCADDVCIDDIAHALSHICRFGGHCREFYSVAQHSCLVADIVVAFDRQYALSALLHDAAEAYVGDIIRPIKRFNAALGAAEAAVFVVIAAKFGLPAVMPRVVKWADNVMLRNEHHQLMNGVNEWPSCDKEDGPSVDIVPWSPVVARAEFLNRFNGWTGNG